MKNRAIFQDTHPPPDGFSIGTVGINLATVNAARSEEKSGIRANLYLSNSNNMVSENIFRIGQVGRNEPLSNHR